MGSTGSVPRKLTINNPDDATIIKVTENVVDRLQEANTKEDASLPQNAIKKTEFLDGNSVLDSKEAVFISSFNIKSQIENAIEKNDKYWENRIKLLRDVYRKINVELKNEYDKAITEVNQSLGKQYLTNDKGNLQLCQNVRNDVIQCYNANKNRPLLCHEEVKNFNQCVFNQTDIALKVI